MYEETARRLKEALNRKGISQQELADLSGINKASVSQYVNGSHAPGNISAHKMAKVLDVPAEYLMGFEVCTYPGKYAHIDVHGAVNLMIELENQEIISIINELTKDEKNELLTYAKFLISKRAPNGAP